MRPHTKLASTPSATTTETTTALRSFTATRALKRPVRSPNSQMFERIRETTTEAERVRKSNEKHCLTPRKSVSRHTSLSNPSDQVAKHIAFSPSELEPESAGFSSSKPIKRTRERPGLHSSKKTRSRGKKDSSRLHLQLYTPEGKAVYFPCFHEEAVISQEDVRGHVIAADCDDDCQTDDEQARDAQSSLRDYLEKAISREEKARLRRKSRGKSRKRCELNCEILAKAVGTGGRVVLE